MRQPECHFRQPGLAWKLRLIYRVFSVVFCTPLIVLIPFNRQLTFLGVAKSYSGLASAFAACWFAGDCLLWLLARDRPYLSPSTSITVDLRFKLLFLLFLVPPVTLSGLSEEVDMNLKSTYNPKNQYNMFKTVFPYAFTSTFLENFILFTLCRSRKAFEQAIQGDNVSLAKQRKESSDPRFQDAGLS
ncbi:hypothetical protein NM208_g8502 [Fusarium decemcellulare]|uniref:Uncharacterized protein n=1 Tax=Fusarium decemcellulare TaxID=57161 RepID=A0ACC1S574_9HYPO|nr:hypothetical protein NM208_g8502 [Fusarium decemcellulare]